MKRLLILKPYGGIGDIILATPLIKVLKEELKLEFLAMLVSPYGHDILIGNPYLDEIIIDVHQGDKKKRAPFFYLLNIIKSYKFDGAIVLWSTSRLAWLVYLAGIPVRVGQDYRLLYSFLYTHRVKVRSLRGDVQSHWVECLMDFARSLGAGNGKPELYLPVMEKDKKDINDLLLRDYGIKDGDLVIGFHPGRGIDLSGVNLPYENFARIGDRLQTEFKARVIFTGGDKEKELLKNIEVNMEIPPVNMGGKCNLKQLAAIIDRCNLFISTDSGPMHMAAALKKPVVAIFALKSDLPARWKPYNTEHIVVRKEVNCEDRCVKEECRKFDCMHEIKVEDIIEPVRKLLNK